MKLVNERIMVMTNLFVDWAKPLANAGWYELLTIDVSTIEGEGVYVIWDGGTNLKALYVGRGIIADRLSAHQRDQKLLNHKRSGSLLVSWAPVSSSACQGVERYLIETYKPFFNQKIPGEAPITVNLLG